MEATLTRQQRMDRLAEICLACDQTDGDLFCKTLGLSVNCLISCAAPFCPIGKHEGMGRTVDRAAFPTIITAGPNRKTPDQVSPDPQDRWCRLRDRLLAYLAAPLKIGLAALRAYRPTEKVVEGRRTICRGDGEDKAPCEHRRRLFGIVDHCRKCGCSIRAKTALAPEACPIRKWRSATPKGCGCGG